MKTEIELGNSTKNDQWKNSQGKEAEKWKVIGLPENPLKKKKKRPLWWVRAILVEEIKDEAWG